MGHCSVSCHEIWFLRRQHTSQERVMFKWQVFFILTELLCSHLSYMISHYESLGYFIPCHNWMIPQFLHLSKPCDFHTVNQIVEFSHVYHNTTFKRNQFITIKTETNLTTDSLQNHLGRFFSYNNKQCTKKEKKKCGMSLNKITGCGTIPNLIQIDSKICEKVSLEVPAFSYKFDLGWRSKSFKLEWNYTF